MDHAAVARRRDADAPLSPRSFLVATAFFLTWQLCATWLGYPRWFRLYVAALAARFAGHPAAQPSTHAARSTTIPVTPLSPPGVLLQPHLFAGLRSSFFLLHCLIATAARRCTWNLEPSLLPHHGSAARRAAAVSTPLPGPTAARLLLRATSVGTSYSPLPCLASSGRATHLYAAWPRQNFSTRPHT